MFVCRYLKSDAAAYEGFPNDTASKLAYVVQIFQEVMVPHIRKEDYLFELCRGHHADIDALLDELLAEHRVISGMYGALAGHTDLVQAMDELAHSLEAHIRKEERVLFERLQEVLPAILEQLKF